MRSRAPWVLAVLACVQCKSKADATADGGPTPSAAVDASPGASAAVASSAPVCAGSVCTIASHLHQAGGLAVGVGRVFFGTGTFGQEVQLWSLPTSGGAAIALTKKGQGGTHLVLHGTSLYWTSQQSTRAPDGGWTGTTSVWSVPVSGGAPAQVASGGGRVGGALAIDGSTAFWVADATPDEIDRAELSGGPSRSLATGHGNPRDLAVDETFLYWPQGTKDHILKMGKNGGPPVPIADNQSWPDGLAIDATHVYWTCNGTPANHFKDGTVAKIGKTGGKPTVLATDQAHPTPIAVGATAVYWANTADHTILSVPLAGGTPRLVATASAVPSAIAVDDTSVYWLTQGEHDDGTVTKAPR